MITTQAVPTQYSGNGATVAFSFPYLFTANSDLVVVTTVDSTGVDTVLSSGFTITGAGNPAGGTVTFSTAPAAGITITIYRAIPETQPVDYVAQDNFPAEVHEGALDRLTAEVQDIKARVDRSLRIPLTNVASKAAEMALSSRLSSFIGFDAAGAITFTTQAAINASAAAAAATYSAAAATSAAAAATSQAASNTSAMSSATSAVQSALSAANAATSATNAAASAAAAAASAAIIGLTPTFNSITSQTSTNLTMTGNGGASIVLGYGASGNITLTPGTSGSIIFASNISVGTTAPVTEWTVFSSSASAERGIMSAQYSNDTLSSHFIGRKSRGTAVSPSVILSGDYIASFVGEAIDSSGNYLQMGAIRIQSVGTIGTNRVATSINFYTGTDVSTSVLTLAMFIDQNQALVGTTAGLTLKSGTTANNQNIIADTNGSQFQIKDATLTNSNVQLNVGIQSTTSNLAIISSSNAATAGLRLASGNNYPVSISPGGVGETQIFFNSTRVFTVTGLGTNSGIRLNQYTTAGVLTVANSSGDLTSTSSLTLVALVTPTVTGTAGASLTFDSGATFNDYVFTSRSGAVKIADNTSSAGNTYLLIGQQSTTSNLAIIQSSNASTAGLQISSGATNSPIIFSPQGVGESRFNFNGTRMITIRGANNSGIRFDQYTTAGLINNNASGDIFTTNSPSVTGTYTSGAPAGASSGAWKFGSLVTGLTLTANLTQAVYIDIGGVVYKLITGT